MYKLALPTLFRRRHWALYVVIAGIALMASGIFAIVHMTTGKPIQKLSEAKTRWNAYDPYTDGIYKIEPADPAYPPPAKEQRSFYRIYNTQNVGYSLEWTTRNAHRNPAIGAHTFTLVLENFLNHPQTIDGDLLRQVSTGCIASDGPYRTSSVTLMSPLTLEPYEHRRIPFKIDVSCMYLGTADGQYYWRIY